MPQKDPKIEGNSQPREMPPKGMSFTTWEQDKKDFITYYGHLVSEDKHSLLIKMLSDLKECRMARLAEQREDGELGADEPRYFDNTRDLDDLLEDYASHASIFSGSKVFDLNLSDAFLQETESFVNRNNLELLLLCYEQETLGHRKLRRQLIEPVSATELRKLGIT